MQSDFDDLRFTQADGQTLIDAWLETKTDDTSATVWAEFPTTPANTVEQTYYMYYGKVVASDWDGAATFPFFDDFPGTSVDTNKWTVTGSPSVSGGILTVAGSGCNVKSISSFANTYSLRTRVTNQTATSNASALFSWFGADKYDYVIYGNYPTASVLNAFRTASALSPFSLGHDGAATYLYELQRSGTQCAVYEYQTGSPVLKGTITGGTSSAAHVYYGNDGNLSPSISVDWTLIRKYASGPPTYAFGGEESAPTGGNPFWYYQLLRRRNQ